jgi:general secretion pathway protein G
MRWAQLNTEPSIANKRGFTIVELLIVIVVVAILAAISVVGYTGIQGRAVESRASSELRSLQTAMEVFIADHGRKPSNAGSGNNRHPEVGEILRQAGLFEATRPGVADIRRFAFCLSPEHDDYAIAAYLGSRSDPVYYTTRQSGLKKTVFTEWLPGESTAANLCASAAGEYMNSEDWVRGSPPWAVWAEHGI